MIIDSPRLFMEFRELLSNLFIHVLFIAIVFDIVTGIVKGTFFKNGANSTKGLPGLIKHTLVFMLILFFYPYASILGYEFLGNWVVVFFIVQYAISIVENFGQMGVRFPTWVTKRLEKLSNDSDEEPKK